MGDREDAADALAHMPRWVAVRDSTLAALDVIVARTQIDDRGFGFISGVVREMDEARDERDRAVAATTPPTDTASAAGGGDRGE